MKLNLGTTGIGSHPISNPNKIISDIFESQITHPYIPQLSTDEMILQFHHKFPALENIKGSTVLNLNKPDFEEKIKDFKETLKFKSLLLHPHGEDISPKFFNALYLFSELLNDSPKDFKGIKCQITGPITEAASIKIRPGNTKLIKNRELFELIVDLSAEVAHWLSSYLLKIADSNNIPKSGVILFIDEPLFPNAVENEITYEEALNLISKVLQLIQCKSGIHICDNPITIIDTILKYPIDLFSYDAIRYPDSLKNTNIDILSKYIENGGGFAFGVTPNTPETLFGVEELRLPH